MFQNIIAAVKKHRTENVNDNIVVYIATDHRRCFDYGLNEYNYYLYIDKPIKHTDKYGVIYSPANNNYVRLTEEIAKSLGAKKDKMVRLIIHTEDLY